MGGVDDVEDDLFFEKLDAAVHEFLVEHQYQMRSTRRGGGEAAKASGWAPHGSPACSSN